MRIARLLAVVVFLTSVSSLHSQESPSLGDIARKLRKEKQRGVATASPDSVDGNRRRMTRSVTDVAAISDAGAYMAAVRELLAREEFSELEQIAALGRSQNPRFPGGGWKLFTFYLALAAPPVKKEPLTGSGSRTW